MSATEHLQADRLSNLPGIQEKCLKLCIIRIFHRGKIKYLEWWTLEEKLEKLLKLKIKKFRHLDYIKKVIYMRNKTALLFFKSMLIIEKRWGNLSKIYTVMVGDPHVPLSGKMSFGIWRIWINISYMKLGVTIPMNYPKMSYGNTMGTIFKEQCVCWQGHMHAGKLGVIILTELFVQHRIKPVSWYEIFQSQLVCSLEIQNPWCRRQQIYNWKLFKGRYNHVCS